MRIHEKIERIDYCDTKEFFERRASKFREDNPYSVTMYQDNNACLVKERNLAEVEKLKPMLKLNAKSRVLDVACGIGRWADAITEEISTYCGIDFSSELIQIAKKRNTKPQYSFYVGAANDVEEVVQSHSLGRFNIVLLIGILMYINDNDMLKFLEQLERQCEGHARICVREPIAIEERLTLKEFYSEELEDNYNAIYRTKSEVMEFFESALLSKGFMVVEEGFLFGNEQLNNRKETSQYYFVLER